MAADRRFLTWAGPALLADQLDNQRPGGSPADTGRAWVWVKAVHAVFGYEIEALPEPIVTSAGRSGRAEVGERHRGQVEREFRRFVHGLFTESYFRHESIDNDHGYFTFDLRIVNEGGGRAEGVVCSHLRLALLVRVSVPSAGADVGDAGAACWSRLRHVAGAALLRIAALVPRDLVLREVEWRGADELDASGRLTAPAELGLGPQLQAAGFDLRRETMFSELATPLLHRDFVDRLNPGGQAQGAPAAIDEQLFATPALWPDADPDLLRTCAVMSSLPRRAVLSCRIVPTLKTALESAALRELINRLNGARRTLRERPRGGTLLVERHLECLYEVLRQRELFCAVMQVAAEDETDALAIISSLQAEFQADRVLRDEDDPSGMREVGTGRLAAVSAQNAAENGFAAYNIGYLEIAPWGAASARVLEAHRPRQSAPDGLPSLSFIELEQRLARRPELYLPRDTETDPRLGRLRRLMTLGETCHMWRLPVVPPGGQAGLPSRHVNPFEKLPLLTPADGDAVSMGVIQHRGRPTHMHFRLPFISPIRREEAVAPIGDRVMVVAGSPGSGKTNFCLHFLSQIYDRAGAAGERRRACHPYLVIDPTRGEEFRALARFAGPDFMLFTIGDERGIAFHFNPFRVPKGVTVQAHISRVLACFKAAYHMWDPLPQIFERAIRRAYKGIRMPLWQQRRPGEEWSAARDVPESDLEPCPNLDDIIGAMGNGREDGGVWAVDGMPTVLEEQKEIWGGQTENAATIVASTFLRLANLRDNFGHILGGQEETGQAIDIRKLLTKPTVLELGTVGDSQALSLIIGFLLAVVAGTIETMGQQRRDERTVHTIVLEEAHRLLSAESGGGGESGNSQRQAAEDINNMLAEVRKYRQGILLIDQRPGSLVGGAIDNAYVVCMHRLNEEKSFSQFAKVLGLTDDQQRFARTELRPGEMILLDRRSGTPILVRAPNLDTQQAATSIEALRRVVEPNLAEVRLPPEAGIRAALSAPSVAASDAAPPAPDLMGPLREVAGDAHWSSWLERAGGLGNLSGTDARERRAELTARMKAWVHAAYTRRGRRPPAIEAVVQAALSEAGHDSAAARRLTGELIVS